MYFVHKHIETQPNCSYELATYLKYHMPLILFIFPRKKNRIALKIYTLTQKSIENKKITFLEN